MSDARTAGQQDAGSADDLPDSNQPPLKSEDPDPPAGCEPGLASHPAVRGAGLVAVAVGALGVVFGDIGTSPLYAMQTVFAIEGHAVKPNQGDVYGVISLVFWSITLVVSGKYILFVLRADNDGEGGVMALAALVSRFLSGRRKLLAVSLILGVVGAALFYGDSVITPAISVLSAMEGLKVASPDLTDAVLPLGIAVLTVLFVVQRFGTHVVGRFFGPIMVLWFLVLAVTGLPEVIKHPDVLRALSPTYIGAFVADHPYLAFVALSAVVLAITGAEALYADMGHFGRAPIRLAWFVLAYPALVLNYLGQGALVLRDSSAISNPFFLLGPSWARIPLVILATAATVIASQAVISGAFSVSRQAMRLGFLPNLTIRHTSKEEGGQIYVPAVNWLLFGGVLILILVFRSSNRLAAAYGLADTGVFLTTTSLFLIVAAVVWKWNRWKIVTFAVVVGTIEVAYFGANIVKVLAGGWLPLGIAAVLIVLMTTWQLGRRIVTRRRIALEGPLQDFVDDLHERKLPRVPGTAVFPHPSKETTPLALKANVDFNNVLHEHVVLVSVHTENVPHVPPEEQIEVDDLGFSDDGIVHLDLRFGFQDVRDVPDALCRAVGLSPELDLDPDQAYYFLSRLSLLRGGHSTDMATWRKRVFIGLAHNAANPADSFKLPDERTVIMGAHLML
ncbi:potassium transporter Kup [uncultured Jatrophihabitans sp.]|uniref:potassium transporter Kup n=1 Tax=uncultured Jatrophihabitans sp. TaxID=1610747 RepID=UPI0035CB22B7